MAQKWYQKASVQGAITGGVFILLAALATPVIDRIFPKNETANDDNSGEKSKPVSHSNDMAVHTYIPDKISGIPNKSLNKTSIIIVYSKIRSMDADIISDIVSDSGGIPNVIPFAEEEDQNCVSSDSIWYNDITPDDGTFEVAESLAEIIRSNNGPSLPIIKKPSVALGGIYIHICN